MKKDYFNNTTEETINLDKLFAANESEFIEEWQNFFYTQSDFFRKENSLVNIGNNLANYTISTFFIGIFEFSSLEHLPVYVIRLNSNTRITEKLGKKYQFDIAKYILRNYSYHNGIFFFFNTPQNGFRISLVYSKYFDTSRTYNYYKRNTFFVAPHISNKTFIKQFLLAQFKSLDNVKEAFSLEPVTKEFYQLLENWYYRALGYVIFPADAEKEQNGRNIQLIRFITRIMFVWFMKAKGIVTDDIFDKEKVQNLLNDHLDPQSSSYYLAIIQNLFFATLNTPIEKRKFRNEYTTNTGVNPDYMNHFVFRHHELMKNPDQFEELFNQIPFLNGGLFDCLDMRADDPRNDTGKEIRIDGFTRKKQHQPHFPNFLFFNHDDKNPGIIDILKTFNFTIDENSEIDADVALDPELLGNVFENLLASYNPETAATARKATGSFYTPRDIVDYMVGESLFEFLKPVLKNTPNFSEKLRKLLFYSDDEVEFSDFEKNLIINAILNCKIIDPACGS